MFHSQGPFWAIYPLSVYNNVMLETERLIDIAFPFRAAQLVRKRYRMNVLAGKTQFIHTNICYSCKK